MAASKSREPRPAQRKCKCNHPESFHPNKNAGCKAYGCECKRWSPTSPRPSYASKSKAAEPA